jgi:hypothetical protein
LSLIELTYRLCVAQPAMSERSAVSELTTGLPA